MSLPALHSVVSIFESLVIETNSRRKVQEAINRRDSSISQVTDRIRLTGKLRTSEHGFFGTPVQRIAEVVNGGGVFSYLGVACG